MNQNFEQIGQIDDLIVKYLNHQCTADEVKEIREWIALSEENRRYFNTMQDVWESAGYLNKEFDHAAAYRRFKKQIAKDQKNLSNGQQRIIPLFLRAAVAIGLFLMGVLSYYLVSNYLIQHNANEYAIYVPNGAKTRIVLPDHSVVWLNAGSTLLYGQNFGQKSRQVALVGEGYFEIAHNPAMPFTVKTSEASVKVLGTKFDVNAYPEDQHVKVILLKGSIQLSSPFDKNHSITLIPNELAVIDKTNHQIKVKHVDACDAAAWTKGKVIFDEELFGQIVRRLERDYNVIIDVKNPAINQLRFYGDFSRTQSIEEILNVMTANKEFHYTMTDSRITIY